MIAARSASGTPVSDHRAVHHRQPVLGVLRPDLHMRVDLAQVHVAVAFLIVAPPAEEAAQKVELFGPHMA